MAKSIGLAIAALAAGLAVGTFLGRRAHSHPDATVDWSAEPAPAPDSEEPEPATTEAAVV